MANDKLNRPTKERIAILRNQASYLLWNGKIETTAAKAKSLRSYVEKIITTAINTYEDVVKVNKQVKENDKVVTKEFINDGAKKLDARRRIMAKLYDIQETKQPKENKSTYNARIADVKHPLIEKIFNDYAPKYAERAKELGQGGGYTRIIKVNARRGDAAEMAIIELV